MTNNWKDDVVHFSLAFDQERYENIPFEEYLNQIKRSLYDQAKLLNYQRISKAFEIFDLEWDMATPSIGMLKEKMHLLIDDVLEQLEGGDNEGRSEHRGLYCSVKFEENEQYLVEVGFILESRFEYE